jgi:hypothetical protein
MTVSVPPHRAGDDGADGAEAVDAAATAPFNQRVRVLVDVVDQADELALVRGLLQAQGWSVRAPGPGEAPPGGGERRALVVEVRLNGARWRAERAAVQAVDAVARRHKLAAWVRDAVLVTLPKESRATYRPVPRGSRGVRRLWARLAGTRMLRLPRQLTREQVERELAGRELGGARFSGGDQELVPPPPEDEAAARAWARLPSHVEMAQLIGAVLGAVAAGYSLRVMSGLALGVPVAVLGAVAVVAARFPWQERLPWQGRVAAGAAVALGCAALGWMVADAQPRGEDDLGAVSWLIAGLVIFCAPGVYFAVRQTWLSHNSFWLVPLAVPAAWSMTSWLGRLMRAAYLDGFGIPSGSVRATEDIYEYGAAARPLGLALAFVLLFTAVLGWARYVHMTRGDNRLFAVGSVVILSLLYALTSIAIGMDDAAGAMERAAAEAREGRDPAAYFGLQGRLMCVTPAGDEPVPVENGPVPEGRPVLSFGSSEDWIWVWDAEGEEGEGRTFAVRREDVQLTAPGAPGARCGR